MFRFPWCIWEKCNIMLSDTLLSDNVSPFPERERGQSPHFTFHTNLTVKGKSFPFYFSGISEFTTKLISVAAVRRPQLTGNDELWRKYKYIYIADHPAERLKADILINDLFAWREPRPISLHSFSHCVSVTQTFTGWPVWYGGSNSELVV